MHTAVRDYPPDLRVSDAERDQALSELSEALQAGRITAGEFDQRSGQVLAARTGKELAAPLADLPLGRAPATSAPAVRCLATRIAMAACGVTALSLGGVALANALSRPSAESAKTELAREILARQILARQGLSVPRALLVPPPPPGFDWVGTLTPAAIAVVLVVAIIAAHVTRPRRGRQRPVG